jgi:hypothetical protein
VCEREKETERGMGCAFIMEGSFLWGGGTAVDPLPDPLHTHCAEREFVIDNLLVQIHHIV